jgi:hypothetical protein
VKPVVVPGEARQAVEDFLAGFAWKSVRVVFRSVISQFIQSLENLTANLTD